ncbi:Ig-like domain-containing protein [Zobellia alginiliquefaciens]|uniref:Ig-like domain-containing protein n=1 Tax=Zobellia alginiliquefaciens TaxID=3032586 RepID=UPI0023E3CC5B|nr:Ig-like domain-containing protein [Zobellia alginiliquefaciens]
MKNFYLIGFLILFCSMSINAQDGLNISGADISITPGATVRVLNGDFRVSGDAEVKNESAISVDGNWLNNNSTGQVFTTDSEGTVILTKTTDVTTVGGSTTTLFYNLVLEVDQASLEVNTIVGGSVSGTNLGVINLNDSRLDLNSNTLQITNSLIGALISNEGYIVSEDVLNESKVMWQTSPLSSTQEKYTIPFATTAGELIPLSIERASGDLGVITVSTYSVGSDMLPLPMQPEAVVTMLDEGGGDLNSTSVNRFWQLDKTGTGEADLTLTYTEDEVPSNGEANLSAYRYDTNVDRWQKKGAAVLDASANTLMIERISEFSPWTLSEGESPIIDLNEFTAGVDHELPFRPTTNSVGIFVNNPFVASDDGSISSATIEFAGHVDPLELLYVVQGAGGDPYFFTTTTQSNVYTVGSSSIRITQSLNNFTIEESSGGSILNEDFVDFLNLLRYGDLSDPYTDGPRTAAITITDTSSRTATATSKINVYTTAPVAVDDANTIIANNTGTVTGNVLTGGTPDSGTGLTVSEVDVYPAQVGVPYETLYGTFTINMDGSYSYDVDETNSAVTGLKNGESIQDIVSYTLKDENDLIDYGILTITIDGVDEAPVALDNTDEINVVTEVSVSGNIISDIGVDGADFIDRGLSTLVWENEFSAPGGVFAGVSAPVNGQNRTISGVTLDFTSTDPSAIGINDQNQTVVQTGTNGGHTGYLLFAIDADTNPSADTELTIDFTEPVFNLGFLITDIDFPQGSSWQDQIKIKGYLDGTESNFNFTTTGGVVNAGNDTYYGIGSAIPSDATGNVNVFFEEPINQLVLSYNYGPDATDADQLGQIAGVSDIYWQGENPNIVISEIDGSAANVNAVYTGIYGSIVVQSDGSYTYTPDTNNPLVANLLIGDTLTETFEYRLSDGSNSDTANLIIVLRGTQFDSDEDGVIDSVDLDDDNDGILDTAENAGGFDPNVDDDSDGIENYKDSDFGIDANGDGVVDSFDIDSDGVSDHLDTDSDNDGCLDAVEAGHLDTDNDGEVDGSGYDANGQVTGAATAYTGTTNGVTTASQTSIDTTPTNQEERVGDDATFTVAASALDASSYSSGTPTYDVNADAGLTYQWQVSTNSGSTFSDISGATNSSLTISDVTLIMDGNIYKVLVSSANNSCPEEAQATLTVINNVDAIDDSAGITAVEGFFGVTDVLNVFDNDEFNGAVLNPTSVTITPVTNGPLTVNGDGSVDVANNTGTGSYTVNYQICDAANPTNCDTATVTVNVGVNSLPTAQDDEVSIAQDTSNNSIDVLANNGNGPDSFGGDGPNAGAITLPSTTSTNGGTVSIDNNSTPLDPTDDTVLYTPAAGYSGADSFTYTITDANNDSSTATVNVTVVPTPTIAINVVAVDDIINATEDDSPVTISGTTTNVEDGQIATVILNGTTYSPSVTSGAWTFNITAIEAQALDPTETITADVENSLGTSAVQATRDIQHITTLPVPVLEIDDITADNILNATEAGGTVAVTGTVSGDFNTGDTVTLTVDGTDYTGTVDAAGDYSIDVPGSALAADSDNTVDGSVTTTDAAGNSATVTDTQLYSVDTTLPVPVLDIDDITADNILNATEAGGTVAVTGTVSGDFNTGDTVTLTVDGTDYTGTIDAAGDYSIDVPGSALASDGDTTVDGSVTTTDAAGNSASATDTQLYSVDTTLPVPVLDIDDITADNILNATEAGGTVAVTGTVSGDFNTGDTVTLTVDGTDYTGTIDAAGDYSIDVPGSALASDGDTTVDGSVTTTDAAGNSASATDTQLYSVDTTLPVPVLDIDDITADNILNATEAGGTVAVTGTVSGDFNTGDTVTLTVDGTDYTGTVDAAGDYSIDVPGSALASDGDTTVDGSVTTTDAAGNSATVTDTQLYSVDTTLPVPVLEIDDITADNILNATEAGGTVAVTGTVSGDFNTGDTVTLTVDGTDYTGTIDAAGDYSIDVPGSALASDGDTTVDGSVTTTDAAGNSATVTDTQLYSVDTTVPVPVLEIDDITADNILNATEAGGTVAVTGTVSGDFNTGDTVTLTVDGTNYTGTIDAAGDYSIDVPGSALASDGDTTVDGSVTTTDAAGNSATVTDTQLYSVDTTVPVPVLEIDDITADNILNATEAGGTVAVTGTVSGDFNTGDTVTLTVDGTDYTGTVDAAGDYSIDVPGSALAADSDNTVDGSVTTTDAAGNSATVTDTQLYSVDTTLPVPVLDIDDITADNILNATEAGGTVAVTGTVSGDFNTGDTVTLTVDGTDYTGTIDAAGDYSIDVPGSALASDGDTTVDGSVTTTDAAGNSASATDTQLYSVDTTLPVPVLDIDDITADNILNATEAGGTVAVTGTVSGDFNTGDTVTLTVDGTDYTGTIDAAGDYSIDVPGSALASDGDTTVDGSVTTTDAAGNSASATDTQLYSVDTTLPVPVLDIDDITADNILNATEAGGTVAVTGTVSGDFNTGDTVTLTVDGTDYTGTIDAAGDYSIDVPGSALASDGDTTVDGSVTTTDAAGNSASATDTQLYSVDTTLPVPVLDIDDITADNILNATEAGGTVAVTGTVSGDFNTGDTVTLTVDGTDYTGTVDAAGDYSIDVPGSALASDGDTTVDGSVTTTDAAGNSATVTDTQLYSVDTTLPVPVLEIDDITADNILNATEAGGTVAVTGTVSGDFNTGDTVTLTVDGTDYTGTVDAAGDYSIDVPGSALASDGDTTVDGSVTTTDAAGNSATVTDTQLYSVDTTLPVPVLEIDDITADNILNATEAGGTVAVTGTVSGDFNTGDTVTLTVDGTDYTGTIDAAGDYSIGVPGSALASDGDTTVDGSVTTTDAAGNSATVTDTQLYSVDTTLPVPVLEIDDITADNILNATEAGGTVAVTGTVSGDFNTGDTVTLTVDGTDYTGTVDAAGDYSIDVPGSALASDGDTTVDGSVTTTDAAGNSATVTDTQLYSVDTTLPVPVLEIDDITADNILNATEAGGTVAVTGTVSGDFNTGDTVTLTVDGTDYTGTVDAAGDYSIDVPGSALASDGDTTVDGSVTTTDAAGNSATVTDTQLYSVDTTLPVPVLEIDDITADNILNATEAGGTVAVTGTVSGDFNTGDTVTLTVDGTDYTGTVDAAGDYSIDVPGSALASDGDTTVDGSVTTTDAAGNTASATDTQLYSVDTTVPVPVLEIDDITADNILNATEAGGTVAVTGTVSGDFNTGDTVTLTVDGTNYTGTIDAAGDYSIDVPGSALASDGDTTVDGSVTTTDAAGNSATVTDTQLYSVDTTLPVPVLEIDDITADNILNATEAGGTVAVTGTVSGDFNTGDTVTLTVDGTDYTGTVDAAGDYSIDVPGSALASDGDTTVDGSVTTTDAAGNSATVTDTQLYSVDTTLPVPVLEIDDITADNILNATEAGGTVAVTGTVSGDFNTGDTVTLTVDGTDYTGTVDAAGDYSIDVPGSALASDGDTTVDGSVTTTDAAGNSATVTDTQLYSVDTTLPVPVLDIDDITADNILNAAEAGGTVAVTGTVSGDFNTGDTVTLTVDGTDYTGTIDAAGDYSIDVPGSALASDGDTTVDGSVTTTDAAGNTGTVTDTQAYTVDTTSPAVSINVVAGDDIINDTEDDNPVTISGTTSNVENGQTVTVNLNGETYTAIVSGNAWTLDIPAADAQALPANATITADVSDLGGNAAVQGTRDVEHDATPPVPVLSIGDITADNILNGAEAGADVTVTGNVTGDFNTGDTVTLTVDGTDYTGTVDAAGDYSIDIPGSILAADGDTTVEGSFTTTDAAGNSTTVTEAKTYTVDTVSPAPVLSINDITADNILNATEAGGTVAVTGTVSGDFNTGDTVTLTVDGTDYTGTIDAAGDYSIDVPGSALASDTDTTVDGSVTTTDAAGNSTTLTEAKTYTVDTVNPAPVLSIDNVTADNILNATEAGADVTVTGNVTGDFNDGDIVTLTVDGTDYTGAVDALGAYSIDIPGSALAADNDTTIDGSISTTDINGNTGTSAEIKTYSVDDIAPVATVIVDDITNDNSINAAEAGSDIPITGMVSGDFNENDPVTIVVNGNTYTGTVDALGNFSIDVPGSDLVADNDSSIEVSLTTLDTAGNSTSVNESKSYAVDIVDNDLDNDGLTNDEEDDLGTDPNNPDSDGDGINDGQEVLDATDPLNDCDSIDGTPLDSSDCDSDGLTNAEEAIRGTDPNIADTDEDMILDGQEVSDNTDPLNACSSIGGTPPETVVCGISVENDLVTPELNEGRFLIENIESYPQNTVKIFNRWGIKVFEIDGYDNEANVFTGMSTGRITIRANDELPVGVYFYIIEYVAGDNNQSLSGYLYINR